MILQAFRFHLASDAGPIFSGTTRFGFFPAASLRTQAGIPGATLEALPPGEAFAVPRTAPLLPEDPATPWQGLAQPAGAWQMLDRVDACAITADGGFIAGSKDVRPDEWFFTAHFPGDPVMPGSLGIEAFLQLLRFWAERRWPDLAPDHRILSPAPGVHRWAYRGQVRPTSQRVEVQARIRHVEDGPSPSFTADGLLAVDGKVIYSMHDYLLALVPEAR
jgi:3-hydroxymyristoyl/3-hydroxydecanoyl-(acyl carrier protein) dehydratase